MGFAPSAPTSTRWPDLLISREWKCTRPGRVSRYSTRIATTGCAESSYFGAAVSDPPGMSRIAQRQVERAERGKQKAPRFLEGLFVDLNLVCKIRCRFALRRPRRSRRTWERPTG